MLDKIQDFQVPIDLEKYDIPQYEYYRRHRWSVFPNCVFEDELQFVNFHKTRGSAYMEVRSTITNMIYYIRWIQLKDLIENGNINHGRIRGIFSFIYKWNKVGIGLFDPEKLSGIIVHPPDWWNAMEMINPRIEI